ncbi:hypothetical protein CR513_32110, partial [Mucuna pruriens]
MVISVVTIDYKVERVTIKGVIELETTFEERMHTRTISVLYTIVNVDASYNIIMGKPTLNKLGAVVSTLHWPVTQRRRKLGEEKRQAA